MKTPSDPTLALALAYLRRRERTVDELRAYLASKGRSSAEIDLTLAICLERGFVNDQRVADRETDLARNVKRAGREKLKQRLVSRGLLDDEAEPGGYTLDQETENAIALLEKKQVNDVAHAIRALSSRGYSEEAVRAALAKRFPEWDG